MTYLDTAQSAIELPEDMFDPEAIASIKQLQIPNGPDILEQFIKLFLDTAKNLINDFNLSLQNNDFKGVLFSIHTLKSSSASLGANALTALCVSIETAASNIDIPTVLEKANDLRAEFKEVEAALEQCIVNKKHLILE